MTTFRLFGALAVVAALFALSACGTDEPARPDVPDNAVPLVVNQPTGVAGIRVVATGIEDDSARLEGGDGTVPFAGGRVDVGQSIEISGVTLRLVATWVDPDPGEGDGADRSKVWVVEE